MTRTRTLEVRPAFLEWLRRYKITDFDLADKFTGDHTLERLSSSRAAEKALDRFRKNRNTLSSWMDTTTEGIMNKVKGAVSTAFYHATKSGVPENAFQSLLPCVHRGGQQLAVRIKCSIRTVRVHELTRDEAMRGANKNRHHEVKLGGTTFYLLCKSTEVDTKFWIVGAWKPLEQHFNLYHYQSSPTPEIGLVPKFQKWIFEDDNETIVMPHAAR